MGENEGIREGAGKELECTGDAVLTGEPRAAGHGGGFTGQIHGLEQGLEARGAVPGQTPATPQGGGFSWNSVGGRGFIMGAGHGRAEGGCRSGRGGPYRSMGTG